ncbi:hypothetical protein E2C01_037115 [Portunus trituberculatus]|uniref:Uncharacterized protein n=1 Tax=Portunus trituberculatus TaxID=210409 RepID=A0A5B7FEH8_PORTR|nr:hypothetical protein [Portunus trituberculatus]
MPRLSQTSATPPSSTTNAADAPKFRHKTADYDTETIPKGACCRLRCFEEGGRIRARPWHEGRRVDTTRRIF